MPNHVFSYPRRRSPSRSSSSDESLPSLLPVADPGLLRRITWRPVTTHFSLFEMSFSTQVLLTVRADHPSLQESEKGSQRLSRYEHIDSDEQSRVS